MSRSEVSRSLKERAHELETCAFCPKLCRFACPVAEAEFRETVTPWGLMTRLDDLRRGGRQFDADLGELLSHCTTCGRCAEICKHSNDVAGTILAARATADRLGVLPDALRNWALESPDAPASWRELPVDGPTRILPGRVDEAEVVAALKLLAAAGYYNVGRLEAPLDAGSRLLAAGRPGAANARAETVAQAAAGLRLVCLDAADVTRLQPILGNECCHLVDALQGRLPPLAPTVDAEVLYLDGCKVGRGLGAYDGPRRMLADVVGGVREAVMNRAEGGCCGGRAGYAVTASRDARIAANIMMEDEPELMVVIADCECAAHLAASSGRDVQTWAQTLAMALPEDSQPAKEQT